MILFVLCPRLIPFFKNRKVLTPDLQVALYKMLGAATTSLPGGEVVRRLFETD